MKHSGKAACLKKNERIHWSFWNWRIFIPTWSICKHGTYMTCLACGSRWVMTLRKAGTEPGALFNSWSSPRRGFSNRNQGSSDFTVLLCAYVQDGPGPVEGLLNGVPLDPLILQSPAVGPLIRSNRAIMQLGTSAITYHSKIPWLETVIMYSFLGFHHLGDWTGLHSADPGDVSWDHACGYIHLGARLRWDVHVAIHPVGLLCVASCRNLA